MISTGNYDTINMLDHLWSKFEQKVNIVADLTQGMPRVKWIITGTDKRGKHTWKSENRARAMSTGEAISVGKLKKQIDKLTPTELEQIVKRLMEV